MQSLRAKPAGVTLQKTNLGKGLAWPGLPAWPEPSQPDSPFPGQQAGRWQTTAGSAERCQWSSLQLSLAAALPGQAATTTATSNGTCPQTNSGSWKHYHTDKFNALNFWSNI